MTKQRQHLLDIFQAALDAVSGQSAVSKTLKESDFDEAYHVIAIGKAADSMLRGVPSNQIKSGLLISKHNHITEEFKKNPRIICIESDHPVPKDASLNAGRVLLQYIEGLPEGESCLFLISGGASALVEVLEDGWDLSQLQKLTDYLLANAYPINEINAFRKQISKIKGGALWSYLGDRSVNCLMISDVPSDDPKVIGSGLLFPEDKGNIEYTPPSFYSFLALPDLPEQKIYSPAADFSWKIVASLSDAKRAAAIKAKKLGFETTVVENFLDDEAAKVAISCVDTLKSNSGVLHIWGGETMVYLPEDAGMGGRNQHLALSAAIHIQEEDGLYLLAAGTDGSDGMTVATGALVDSDTVNRGLKGNLDAQGYLERADSNSFFQVTGDLIETGATGTNVMDLVIGIKMEA